MHIRSKSGLLWVFFFFESLSSQFKSWQGGFNLTYYATCGEPLQVRLGVQMTSNISHTSQTPDQDELTLSSIINIIGKFPGELEPDRIVLLGNHRDAWTSGALDPGLGTASLIEVASAFGNLYSQGWRPRRSIWIASWDAEEFGLIGSTEFTERFESLLSVRLIAYINVDVGVAGMPYFAPRGTPSLTSLVQSVAEQVVIPPNNQSLLSFWQMYARSQTPQLDGSELGAASDYGSFVQHLGIAAVDLRIRGAPYAYESVYHTKYDTPAWYERFGDDNFTFAQALTSAWSLVAFHLANDLVLPFNLSVYSDILSLGAFSLSQSLLNSPLPTPSQRQLASQLLQDLHFRISVLSSAIETHHQSSIAIAARQDPLEIRSLNDRLFLFERQFLYSNGIPGHEWVRNLLWSSSKFDDYGSAIWNCVLDPLVEGDFDMALRNLGFVITTVDNAIVHLS